VHASIEWAREEALVAEIRTSRLVVIGLALGVVAALAFLSGGLERFEVKRYDYQIDATAQASLGSMETIGLEADAAAPGGQVQAIAVTEVLRALEGAGTEAIVINDPVAGSTDELSDLAETVAAHETVVVSYSLSDEEQQSVLEGGAPGAVSGPSDELSSPFEAFNLRIADSDGVLRRFIPTIGQDQGEVGLVTAFTINPNFVLPMSAASLGSVAPKLGDRELPMIRYESPVARVLSPRNLPLSLVRGRTVLIGRVDDAATTWDTPVGELKDVQVTHMIANGLLTGRHVNRAPPWTVAIAVIGVSFTLLMGINQRRPVFDFLYLAGIGGGIWVLSGFAFDAGTWVDFVPIAVLLIAHAITQPMLRGGTVAAASAEPEGSPPTKDQESVGSL
jgi:hypothetical protein